MLEGYIHIDTNDNVTELKGVWEASYRNGLGYGLDAKTSKGSIILGLAYDFKALLHPDIITPSNPRACLKRDEYFLIVQDPEKGFRYFEFECFENVRYDTFEIAWWREFGPGIDEESPENRGSYKDIAFHEVWQLIRKT